MKRMACVIALATGTGVLLGASPFATQADTTSELASGLQLAVTSPGVVVGESSVKLDVTFRGGNIRSLELFVDGTLVRKHAIRTSDARGVIHLVLDGLTEGEHEIIVRATDLSGATATTSTRLKITPTEEDAPVRWKFPKPQSMVQGVVPIQVQVDRSIRNPYVTFLINNDFLAFINLPPFTYNWDTTRLPNGDHTIGVEVYDGESLARVKTLSMKVRVNNPGGFTRSEKPQPATPVEKIGPGVTESVLAESARLSAELSLQTRAGKIVRIGNELIALPRPRTSRHNNPIQPSDPAKTEVSGVPNLFHAVPATEAARMARTPWNSGAPSTPRIAPPAGAGSALAAPPTRETRIVLTPGMPAPLAPASMVKDLATTSTTPLSRIALRPRRAGNVAAVPPARLPGNIASPTQPASSTPKPVRMATAPAPRTARVQSIQIAFDQQRLAFDVPPRVENGLPLAPFRTIFEHTGGRVEWYHKSRTVRAINTEREIEFRIGQKEATVNNRPLHMETTPYVDRGRAIVPLSFVRDAMNVKVHYDASTGRIVIESNR